MTTDRATPWNGCGPSRGGSACEPQRRGTQSTRIVAIATLRSGLQYAVSMLTAQLSSRRSKRPSEVLDNELDRRNVTHPAPPGAFPLADDHHWREIACMHHAQCVE